MRSEERIRSTAMLVLLAALAVPSLSADPLPGEEAGAGEPAAETAGGASEQSSSREPAEEPVEPFVPSESISADSAVAFPVDI